MNVSDNKDSRNFHFEFYRIAYFVTLTATVVWVISAGLDLWRFPKIPSGTPEAGFAGIGLFFYHIPRWAVLYCPALFVLVWLVVNRPKKLRLPDTRIRFRSFVLCILYSALAIGVESSEIVRAYTRKARATRHEELGISVSCDTNDQPLSITFRPGTLGDARFGLLREFESLRMVHASATDARDDDLTQLARLHSLAWLDLDSTLVTDEGIRVVARIQGLENVSVENCAISDAGAELLAALPRLRNLSLRNTDLTDGGLLAFRSARALKAIDVRGTAVTLDGVSRLRTSLPKCRVVSDAK